MFAFEVLEVELYLAHVLVNVAGRVEFFADGATLLGVVDAHEYDGDSRTFGDVVESFLPIWIGLASTLGRDGQVKLVAFFGNLDDLVYE